MIYHYYGDTVRKIFLAAALIMTASLPFFANIIPGPFEISVLTIPVLVLAAGLTNPRQIWLAAINTLLSVLGSVIFEYYAVVGYQQNTFWYFLVNQILAILFLFAVYLSTKTWRGRKHEKEIADID